MGRLAEEERLPLAGTLEPEDEPHERRLPAAVRPGKGDELTLGNAQRDVLEDALSGPVAERHSVELDRYRHPSAFLSVTRFRRITVK
jgi:hypothetical protein